MIDICKMVESDKRYFIYGTAVLGRFCCEKLCERYGDDKVIAYIETSPENTPFDGGKKIITPKMAKELSDENTGVIITGRASADIMKQNCLDAGFAEERIIKAPRELLDYLKTGYSFPLNSVCFWPPINNYCADLLQKIKFYILDRVGVKIFTNNPEVVKNTGDNVDICDELDKEKILKQADAILLWNVEKEDTLFTIYPDKIRIVDPYYWEHIDTTNYIRLYHDSFSKEELKSMEECSKKKFAELQKLSSQYKNANVFCSGPSISEIYDMPKESFQEGLSIICNSMIKDAELMELLNPKVLCFIDTNFFHSPGEYGEVFYRDLRETYRKYEYYAFVRDIQYPLLLKHCPEMKDRVIGISPKGGKEYWFVSQKNFSYRPLGNVMTEIMIPLASAISDEIGIAGCTGRGGEKNYFWKHNDRTQYLDLKKYVMETWPAFFKYRRYDAYYSKHCQIVEEQLSYGESIGKKYKNITTSYIPALMKRSEIEE